MLPLLSVSHTLSLSLRGGPGGGRFSLLTVLLQQKYFFPHYLGNQKSRFCPSSRKLNCESELHNASLLYTPVERELLIVEAFSSMALH